MATTSRKKVKESEKDLVDTDKYLSPDDHRQILVLPKEVENAQLLMAVEEQALKNLLLEHKLLEINIQKQKEAVVQKSSAYENMKKKYNLIIRDISNKYDLKGEHFSYDNETGKLIE
jgi:hypothetical protein